MALPDPEPGLVISYSYLWLHQREKGLEEGAKNRPCVIVLAVEKQDGETIVTVAPVTHRLPSENGMAIEIPLAVKKHLGLDAAESWVILNEVNQFLWPGFDVQSVPGDRGRHAYGFLPSGLFNRIKSGVAELFVKRQLAITMRD